MNNSPAVPVGTITSEQVEQRPSSNGEEGPRTDTHRFDTWLEEILSNQPESSHEQLRRAYALAQRAHDGQTRASGEPYISHCLSTMQILADLNLDPDALAAALLHDAMEDTDVTYDELARDFGTEVANLVDGVTKLGHIDQMSGMSERNLMEDAKAESLRKMFLAMVDDIRVVLIKLADRLHNMRTLGSLPEEKRRRIARETLEIFAPLANRLGIWQMKWELEDLSFRNLMSEKYEEITRLLNERRPDRERYIQSAIAAIERQLDSSGLKADLSGRPKHAYSIYRKMQRKGIEFEQVFDVRAVRIIVESVRDCYAVLGIIHGMWSPIPGEFDDYIATPKDNLYRSLHTAVIGPEGKALEVQIRTHDMHHTAELGIAAHWRYKESHKPDPEFDNKIAWLRQLMEWRQDMTSAHEFVHSLKTDVFQDHVYTFTPNGDIFELPVGSTPIDFAYHVHTEVGNRCRGAKVNGRLVSLDYQLKNGDMVQILTAKRGGPSLDWLNPNLGYVKTTRARSKIRQWFKRQNREQNISQGRDTLERTLKRLGITDVSFDQIARQFNYDNVEDLMAAIGAGDLNTQQIAGRVLQLVKSEQLPLEFTPEMRPQPTQPATNVRVRGVGNLLTHVARCCNPLPGDPVIGYVTRGRGVTIHRRDCPNILGTKDTDRLIEVEWGEESIETYPVHVLVEAFDRPGLMRDITALVAEESINLSAATATTHPKRNHALMTFTLQMTDVGQLDRVLLRISKLPNVIDAHRQTR
jgi:GTP pyrophosphokinase